jgi:hypothetical protein
VTALGTFYEIVKIQTTKKEGGKFSPLIIELLNFDFVSDFGFRASDL